MAIVAKKEMLVAVELSHLGIVIRFQPLFNERLVRFVCIHRLHAQQVYVNIRSEKASIRVVGLIEQLSRRWQKADRKLLYVDE